MMPNNLILKYTGVFCIAGFFIGVLPAMLLLGLQELISSLGLECTRAWSVVWIISAIVSILAPVLFLRFLKRNYRDMNKILSMIVWFLLIEYIFLIGALDPFFSNAYTLCYESDGQNGLEFIFISWLSLPILFALALLFSVLRKRYLSRDAA